jgi:zinc transport system substrate-binding protein
MALMMLMVFTACDNKNNESDGISIVTTIFPIYDFARAIVQDKANLDMLVKPGTEIHTYDPSITDIETIKKCDIFIYIGGESDDWIDKVLQAVGVEGKTIIKLIDSVDAVDEEIIEGMEEEEEEEEGVESEYDEHIWTSPSNAIQLINVICDSVKQADPDNSQFYDDNAIIYKSKIVDIQSSMRDLLTNATRDKIVVADKFPFRYFVDEFDISYYAAFPGCSVNTDPSASTVAWLINKVREENFQCVYYIELSNQLTANAIKDATGCQTILLHSCHNVTKSEFESGVTYVNLMQQNIEALKKGLL